MFKPCTPVIAAQFARVNWISEFAYGATLNLPACGSGLCSLNRLSLTHDSRVAPVTP
jgi:hypothetical protein